MFFSPSISNKLSRSFSSTTSSSSIQTLLKSGFTPTLKSINHLLLFLSKSLRFSLIPHIFSQMCRHPNNIQGNSQTHSLVASALLKLHKFDEAVRFIQTQMANSPNSRAFNSLVRDICARDDPDEAFLALRECLGVNCLLPSRFMFCELIRGFCARGEMGRAIEVLELIKHEKVRYPFDNFICSSVIWGFCKVGKPELGVEFFENAVNVGALRANVVTCTTLVTALCMLGRVDEVWYLVSRMMKEGLQFDVIFYSSWICGYFRGGLLMEAFRKHCEMVGNGIVPDAISYTMLIDGFSKNGNVEKVVGFLDKMKENGLQLSLVTYTTIILGFCKKGKMDEAFKLFTMIEELGIKADEIVYAILVNGLCRIGDFDRVYQLLEEMKKKEINPTIVTYNTLINGLCKLGRTSDANEISKGLIGDIFTYSTLLHGYILEQNVVGILEIKRRSEEARAGVDIVMCNILIRASFIVGAIEDAYAIYNRIKETGLVADSVTYCTMIDGYCKVGRIEEALEIFDESRKRLVFSVACYNCMINGLCKNGMADVASEVFVELNEKGLPLDMGICHTLINAIFKTESADGVLNLVYRLENLGFDTYDTICADAISLFCKKNILVPAIEVYMVARRNQIVLTCKCYYLILKGLINDGKLWLSQPVLSIFVKECGLVEPKVIKTILHFLCFKDINNALNFLYKMKEKYSKIVFPASTLRTLTKDGKVLAAYRLIKEASDNLPAMDVVDYTIIVGGLCKAGYPVEALNLCTFAEKKGITLNIVTYNSIINGLCLQGCLVEAFRLFDSLERINLIPSKITYATLIEYLCQDGYLFDAKQLFERMVLKQYKATTRIYNSFLKGYCKFGQVEEAIKILNDMEKEFLDPDEFTMSALINGYCQKGDMEGALMFFSEYKKKGISPDLLCYLYLMRGLYSKGRMEEARSILREMLQSQSVMEMINRVGIESEIESIESFLAFLCEQGSIKEAITVVDEIGSMLFPIRKSCDHYDESHELHKSSELKTFSTVAPLTVSCLERSELDEASGDTMIVDNRIENADDARKISQGFEFDSYFSLLSSHCSRGELSKANRLAKEMLVGFIGDH